MRVSFVYSFAGTFNFVYSSKLLRSFFTITMLCVIGFNQAGMQLLSVIHRIYVQEEMRERIIAGTDKKELIRFNYTASSKDIIWEEKNKEFSFHDRMYDVVSIDTLKNDCILYCVDDKKETELVQRYERALKHNAPLKKTDNGSEKSTVLYYESVDGTTHFIASGLMHTSCYTNRFSTRSAEIISPPPRA